MSMAAPADVCVVKLNVPVVAVVCGLVTKLIEKAIVVPAATVEPKALAMVRTCDVALIDLLGLQIVNELAKLPETDAGLAIFISLGNVMTIDAVAGSASVLTNEKL